MDLVFATWNVHGCVARRDDFDAARIADTLAATGADVVALQETAAHELRGDPVDHAASIARLLGMRVVFGANVIRRDGRYRFGNALLSRYEITASVNHDLSVRGAEPRGALVADLAIPGTPGIRAASVHLGLALRERGRQARQLLSMLESGGEDGRPLILGGDMNDWFPGHATRALRARLADALRHAKSRRLHDATYPALLPIFRLDHVYVGPGITVHDCHALRTPQARSASDHLPVIARLSVAAQTSIEPRRADAPKQRTG